MSVTHSVKADAMENVRAAFMSFSQCFLLAFLIIQILTR